MSQDRMLKNSLVLQRRLHSSSQLRLLLHLLHHLSKIHLISSHRGGNTVVQPAQPVPPVQLAQPVVQPQAVQDNMVDRLMEMMQDQFGLKPKEQAYMYRKPYPEAYDRIPMPARYKVPDFTKFSGQDNTSTVEHISRFLVQCGEAAVEDALKIRLFPLSLSGSVFAWFSSLPANSIVQ